MAWRSRARKAGSPSSAKMAGGLGRRGDRPRRRATVDFPEPIIPAIFAEDGEVAFRALERHAIAALPAGVVADLGGGAFCDPAGAARLLSTARVVFLDVSAAEAARRIGAGEGRPLAARWEALLARRRPLYARAHLRVEVDGLSPDAVARRILEAL